MPLQPFAIVLLTLLCMPTSAAMPVFPLPYPLPFDMGLVGSCIICCCGELTLALTSTFPRVCGVINLWRFMGLGGCVGNIVDV